MATTEEKLKVFLDKFGSAGKKVLARAEEVEKEAKELGVAFKEASDTQDELEEITEKAKKKMPQKQLSLEEKPEKAEVEGEEPEEEELEEEMGEEVELKKRAVKKDADQVEAIEEDTDVETELSDSESFLDDLDSEYEFEDEDESESKELDADYEFVMGNMTLKEYGDMMAEVFVEALAPMAEELGEIRKLLGRRKEADNLMLESQLEHGQAIEAMQKQFDAIESTLKATRKTLSSLVDEQPKTVVKNYVASEAEETVIPDDHRLKQAAPTADPLADFTKFVIGGAL